MKKMPIQISNKPQTSDAYRGVKALTWTAILVLAAGTCLVRADTVLLSDNFSGTERDSINGNALSINNINSAVWSSSGNAIYTNGNSGTFSTSDNSLLTLDTGSYVANNPGVYTLSLTLNNAGGGSDWYSFGWSALPANGTLYQMASSGTYNVGYAWLLLRGNGQLNVYAGPGASGASLFSSSTGAYGTGPHKLSLVLDTTGANYTFDVFVDSVQLDLNGASAGDTYTYSSNPSVQYVGLSSAASTPAVNDTFGNLSLTTTVVPEPSTMALGVVGGVLLLVWRRKLASA